MIGIGFKIPARTPVPKSPRVTTPTRACHRQSLLQYEHPRSNYVQNRLTEEQEDGRTIEWTEKCLQCLLRQTQLQTMHEGFSLYDKINKFT